MPTPTPKSMPKSTEAFEGELLETEYWMRVCGRLWDTLERSLRMDKAVCWTCAECGAGGELYLLSSDLHSSMFDHLMAAVRQALNQHANLSPQCAHDPGFDPQSLGGVPMIVLRRVE